MAVNVPRLYPVPYDWQEPAQVTIPNNMMQNLITWYTTRALEVTPGVVANPGAGILDQGERMRLDWFHLPDEPFLAL